MELEQILSMALTEKEVIPESKISQLVAQYLEGGDGYTTDKKNKLWDSLIEKKTGDYTLVANQNIGLFLTGIKQWSDQVSYTLLDTPSPYQIEGDD